MTLHFLTKFCLVDLIYIVIEMVFSLAVEAIRAFCFALKMAEASAMMCEINHSLYFFPLHNNV